MPAETLHVRRASLSPSTLDRDAMTIEAVLSTFADAQRPGYVERLDPAGLDPSRLVGAPVLDGHRQDSSASILGVVEAVRTESGKLIGTLRLSSAPDVASPVSKIMDGIIRHVSVGFAVAKWADSTDPKTRQRIRTAAVWQPREVSAVAVPADPGAVFRSIEMEEETIETPAPQEAENDTRTALIHRVASAHNLPDTWRTRMVDAGDELTDDEVRSAGREEALAARQSAPAQPIRVHDTSGDGSRLEHRQEALACRMTGDTPSDAARPFMPMGYHDHAADALSRSGVSTRALSTQELFTRAMHGTSDFPELLTGAGNRVLMGAYRRAETPIKASLARQRTAPDFRPLNLLNIAEFSGMQKVEEHGEIKAMTTSESKEGYAVGSFGGIFSLTFQALANDDTGAFGRWGEMMGRAAAEKEAEELLALLSANGGNGAKLNDGKNLFHADHGNLDGAALALGSAGAGISSLSTARQALRTQKGLDGKTPVGATPRYLLVGPSQETVAEQLLAEIAAATTDAVNPFNGRLQLLVEPRVDDDRWWVFSDPAAAPVLEYAYLSGHAGPQLASRDGWEVLGREYRVVLHFGCGAVDHRGAFYSPGTA